MSTAVIDEVVEKMNRTSYDQRNEVFQKLKPPAQIEKAKTNGKMGYVSQNTIWMRENSHKYPGMYVAIKNGEFILARRTFKEAEISTKELGIERPLLAYVPAENEEVWGGW